MKHLLFRRPAAAGFLAALVLALCASPFAVAQLKKAPSPAGNWEFKTAQLNDRCIISGDMQIRETGSGTAKHFSCTFHAVQSCTVGEIRTIYTDQSCQLTQTGSKISMVSKVERIVKTDPKELMNGMDRRYAPDNFYVTISPDGDVMDGKFESMGEAPVKFRRKGELLS
ncbi:MAG TPA: hypothetical protein VGO52_25080 [Hyphomonadaceae bacterium]|jgi:hypothetical protein|nr:hypothetical protein [Hyphomonadaceae bacterium]